MHMAALAGMCEREFWDATPRWLAIRYRAWSEGQRAGWEQARFLAFYVVKTVDAKNKVKRITDIAKFDWDEPRKPNLQPQSAAEMQQFSDDADEFLKQVNPAAYARYMEGKKAQNGGSGDKG